MAIVLAATLVATAAPTLAATAARADETGGVAGTEAMVDGVSRAWLASAWASYASRFIGSDGRVRDNGNGDVSHSEGQGYGLLLAAMAGDAGRFETVWRWTRSALMVRKDGLAAWKWDPATRSVADANNATDGDILIAWALAEGARRFGRPDYREAGQALAKAIGAALVRPTPHGPVLLPGATGFDAHERPDGPVVNLSYWVYPAFAALAQLAPEVDWAAVRRTGLSLLEQSRFGSFALPTDWETLGGRVPRPAAGFPPAFGYNAIRIPLYLAMDGSAEARRALRRFAGAWAETASATALLDDREAAVTLPVGQPGYDLVLALARCVAEGEAIPPEMISARGDLYYPETLRLLSVLAIQERFPACL